MAGLLSGLEQFGLSNLESMDLYEAPKKAEAGAGSGEPGAAPVVQEQDFLFDKSFTCPICDREFKARTVKIGKAKLGGSDLDLRPRYEQIDLLKYDIIMCPNCGYAALSRFFKFLTSPQAKNIQKAISSTFKPQQETKETYTYDEALERYKLTLANAIVKQARSSEKAYICLKTAWLLRGKAEHLDNTQPDYEEQKKACQEEEDEFLKSALEGFLAARQTESFPMCGMDEPTVDYLIAVTAMRFEQYDLTSRLITGILTSTGANPRMKDKARDVKEMLMKKIKEKNAARK
ncbi:MAG: DUF2225 domain-containing protein [Lachnospiraceae bacterium]|jgi:uncharacterized protein (DUF2225 family)|nr:DUF2225 domain-containing protein [Lachnospiraceae bacterium]